MKNNWYKWIAILLFLFVGLWLGMRMSNYHTITLYYPDDNCEFLVTEERRVSKVDNELRSDQLMEELLAGPQQEGVVNIIPEGTLLLPLDAESPKIVVIDKIAKVNFSPELKLNHPGGSCGEIMTIGAIVNTLTENEDIEQVQIYINGQIVESLCGHIAIDEPIARMDQLIKQ